MREERNKGRWRKRNSEKSSLQSVKGQQPTLWLHLASSLSVWVCVCEFVCVCLQEWKSASVRLDPVYVFVYVSARLWMCVFVHVHACLSVFDCKCMQSCIQSQCECVCVCVHVWREHGPLALQCVSLPDLYTYSETSQWGHICGSDDTWNTRSCLVSGWKTSTWLFELCLEICLVNWCADLRTTGIHQPFKQDLFVSLFLRNQSCICTQTNQFGLFLIFRMTSSNWITKTESISIVQTWQHQEEA